MKHIYEKIDGWFTYPGLYGKMVEKHESGSHFVEVGTWKGKSASYMTVEIINSKKDIKFDCVDTWNGSEEHTDRSSPFYEPLLETRDGLYDKFRDNMKELEGEYTSHRMTSIEASMLYKDESLDFVFIDAAHDYKNALQDITHWIKKVKSGGYLCGHDITYEPVKNAVVKFFKDDYSMIPHEDVWIYKKP